MLSPFSCAFFHPETSDEFDEPIITNSPCSTPRRSSGRRSTGLIHRIHNNNNKDNKNPYSTRGLDKFSALLADLEEKRQQIYAQTGSQDDTFVRFMYKDSNDSVPVPIVLKMKDKKPEDQKTKPHREDKHATLSSEALDKLTVKPSVAAAAAPKEEEVVQQQPKTKFDFLRNINFKRPSFYLPVAVVLILVLLAVFGRSVAILCTSIGWYAIPTLKEHKSNSTTRRRRTAKPKEHLRRSSEKKMVISTGEGLSSPKSDNNTTPRSRKHGHQRSW